MTRLAIGAAIGLAVGVVVGAALGIHAADQFPSQETVAAAAEAGVDPQDLQGAVNATGLEPRAYLVAVGELVIPRVAVGVMSPSSGRSARVRLTYYVEGGRTYSGGQTYPGSTACSWNFDLGTRFVLPDGEIVVCNDRGLLGSSGWLDLWRRPDLARAYGPFTVVQVLP